MVQKNEGIILSGGGSIHANQLGVGAGVRISQRVHGSVALDAGLNEVRAALQSLAGEISGRRDVQNPSLLADHARELADEVAKPTPEPGRIETLLDRLAAGTKSAGNLALGVAALKTAIFGLLGIA